MRLIGSVVKLGPIAVTGEMPRMKAAAAAVLAVVCLGVALILAFVGRAIDADEVRREERLVERRQERMLDALVEDITSAAIWNEAVTAFSGPEPDLEWTQINFGDYYADYMDHAVTLTYAPGGRLVQASRDSEVVSPDNERALVAAVRPLVEQVRRRAAARPAAAVAFEGVATANAIVAADGALYLVAASTVVPEDTSLSRLPQDPIVVSAKPLAALVDSVEADLALKDAALTPAPGSASVPIRTLSGEAAGYLSWTPARPGRSILVSAGPLLLALMLVLGIAAALLWRRIAANVRRLSASEKALGQALERAEAANVAKSRFLSNVSHELRTPLNGVLGMAEVLAMGDLSEVQRLRLQVLKESGQTLAGLIEQLLDVVRLEREAPEMASAPFEPGVLIANLVEEIRPAASAKRLRVVADPRAPGRWLGDAEHIQKVLRCLTSNAVTFTPAGSIRLRVAPAADGLVFVVEDTGVGISPDMIGSLLKPFTQADDSSTRRVGGAGLGLTISHRLTQAMGGRIEIESQEGLGTTVRVFLPLAREAEDAQTLAA